MFIQGNLIGFGMFVIAGIVIAVSHFVLRLSDAVVMISGGITLIFIDLLVRLLMKKDQQGWLMGKNFGGYLFFAPVWIFGIIVAVINIIKAILDFRF